MERFEGNFPQPYFKTMLVQRVCTRYSMSFSQRGHARPALRPEGGVLQGVDCLCRFPRISEN
jgi:hypothetical protein